MNKQDLFVSLQLPSLLHFCAKNLPLTFACDVFVACRGVLGVCSSSYIRLFFALLVIVLVTDSNNILSLEKIR